MLIATGIYFISVMAVAFSLACFVFFRNPKSPLNRLFFLFCSLIAFEAFINFNAAMAETEVRARAWFEFLVLWPFIVSVLFHMIYLHIGLLNGIKKWPILAAVYIMGPAYVYEVQSGNIQFLLKKNALGWAWMPNPGSPVPVLFSAILPFLALITFSFSSIYYFRSRDFFEKRKTLILIVSLFLPLAGGTFGHSLLPRHGIVLPDLALTGFLVGSLILGWGISRYHVLTRNKEALAAKILDSIHDAHFLVNLDGMVINTNHAAAAMCGRSEPSLINIPVEELFQRPLGPGKKTAGELLRSEENPVRMTIKTRDPAPRPVEITKSPLKDPAGDVQGTLLILRDMTEHRIAEEKERQLRRNTALLSQTAMQFLNSAESVDDICDYTGNTLCGVLKDPIIIMNDVSEDNKKLYMRGVWGLHSSLIGKAVKLIKFDPFKQWFDLRPDILNIIRDGRLNLFPGSFGDFCGDLLPGAIAETLKKLLGIYDVYIIGLKREENFYGAIYLLSRDPSGIGDRELIEGLVHQAGIAWHRKLLEDSLRTEKFNAEAANRAKSAFLANMSHEIRTPLNGVFGTTELLLTTTLTDEQKEYIEVLRKSSDSLLDIINEILDLSKIEAGKIQIENKTFSLRGMMEGVIDFFSAQSRSEVVSFLCELPMNLPESATGDQGRIRQVLINLVSNAFKFTPSGEIELKLMLEPPDRILKKSTCVFSVRDTGIGIPENKIKAVFGDFEQADSSTSRRYGGTGLGLSISRRLAELMGGHIEASSREGKGSTFIFTIPLETSLPPSTDTSLHILNCRAIVTGQNGRANQILSGMLTYWGIEVMMFPSEKAMVKAVEKSAVGAIPFVFLNVSGPDDPDLRIADIISSLCENRKLNLILISSLAALAGIRDKCRDLNIAWYLSSPVKARELKSALDRLAV